MTVQRITVDRIALTLEGLPAAQAEVLAAQLQAALAAQAWPSQAAADPAAATMPEAAAARGSETLETRLAGPELVHAVAARLVDLIGLAGEVRPRQEVAPWP